METLFHNINPLNVQGKYVQLNQTAFLLMVRQFARRYLESKPANHSLRKMAILIKDWIDSYIRVNLCQSKSF